MSDKSRSGNGSEATSGRIEQDANGQQGIAVIGMSCLFPGAPNIDAYWQNILNKVDAVTEAPPEAWDLDVYFDDAFTDTDKVYCKRGGYLGPLATFEPLAHGIPPVAVGGEPDQWLALQLARDAMADAGYSDLPEDTRQRTGIILGKGTYLNGGNAIAVEHVLVVGQTLEIIKRLRPEYGVEQIELLRAEMKQSLPPLGPEAVPGLIPNIIVGRIANRLDLMGPAYTVDAACASSLVAIGNAVRDLQNDECDLVLCGGSQVWMPVPTLNMFCQLGALSRQGQIRPFDKDADGTLLGEGIGMVVLKRLTDAKRDGDRIYAVIRGVGVSSDGRGMSVMAPRVEGEEMALRRAYELSGVSPRTVGLIEAHGTATPVGDEAEVRALTRVFGARDGELPSCALGTVKSMISHTIPAAGIAGLIKTSLALYHKVLPPTLHCDEPNPKLELEKTPFYVNTEVRPWIHGGPEPRRAGVNAFGFGGINAHAVLEEYVPSEKTSNGYGEATTVTPLAHLPEWESEVFILHGTSPVALVDQINHLAGFLDAVRADGAIESMRLKDLAYTINCGNVIPPGPCRLSIVATSLEDLLKKLERAATRLADPGCRSIKERTGIYYFSEPLARQGKLAVLFPGEGSQYSNMLADLCLHFPEAHALFDQTDRIDYDHTRGYRLSDWVFPRPAFSADERHRAETHLMQMDLAIEAVLTANRAMAAILERLGLKPDLYMGHSTGEFSALYASGVLDLHDEDHLFGFSRALKRFHTENASTNGIPHAMMLAIGATREQVESIAREAGGDVYLAMDNCPHQAVLVGETNAARRALEIVRREGLIFEELLFDRAYHTPLFAPFGQQLRSILDDAPIRPARVPVYSCTTAAPYPSDPEEVRQLTVEHWSRPVQFRQSIERLHDEGVRVFVEAGPRGNLSAFVEDILRGKPFCVVPANVQRRSGLTQLNHLVGILTAQGVDLDPTYLYARREPVHIPIDDAERPSPTRLSSRIGLSTTWPMMTLPSDIGARLQALEDQVSSEPPAQTSDLPAVQSLALAETEPPELAGEQLLSPTPPPDTSPAWGPGAMAEPLGLSESPARVTSSVDPASEAMGPYFETMDQFLTVAEDVLRAYLGEADLGPALLPTSMTTPVSVFSANGSNGHPTNPADDGSVGESRSAFPLLGSVVSHLPGEELIVRRTFDLDEDLYLRDHTLGRHISRTDPELRALAMMPLTMSLEILAEAAACLLPGLTVIGIRDVRAHRWLAWEDEPQTLEVVARRLPTESLEHAVSVQLWNLEHDGQTLQPSAGPAIEATVVLANTVAPAPLPLPASLPGGEPSRWRPEDLYSEVMFHGPSWQGVTSVQQTSDGGATASLRVLPVDGFFRSSSRPEFLLDPIVLDAAGQVIGFWTAERLARGKIIFPFRLSALDLYGPARPAGEEITCVAAIELVGEQQVRSTIDLIDSSGRLWMRLTGWEDKRFDLPESLMQLVANADHVDLSIPWSDPIAAFPDRSWFRCRRMSTDFPSDRAFWKRVWAQRVLSRAEREEFRRLHTPEHRQLEWLAGRTAAKEAVLDLLRDRFGLDLLPADIEICPDERGRPIAGGAWQDMIGSAPTVSVAHSAGQVVALAGLAPAGSRSGNLRAGIDIEVVRPVAGGFEETALTESERGLVAAAPPDERDEWLLLLWCAKEAASKAVGCGMVEGPESVTIVNADMSRGVMAAVLNSHLATLYPDIGSDHLLVRVQRSGELVIAVTCGEVMATESTSERKGHP